MAMENETFTHGQRVRYIHDGRDIFGNVTTLQGKIGNPGTIFVRAANGSVREVHIENHFLRPAIKKG